METKLTKLLAVAALALLWTSRVSAQTTQLTQTAPGPNCHTYGCINTILSDQETLTWCNTPSCQKFSFRGLNYFATAHTSGNTTVDLDVTAWENNGFAVHTDFDVDCFRCASGWDDGNFTVPNKYIGSDPYLYGYNGSVNVTSGTGQVGVVTADPNNSQTVSLTSSNPNLIQVPAQVTILAGSLDADFTITATAPKAPPLGAPTPVTVTATFQDGTAATMTVTVGTIPASPSTDSKMIYPCGSDNHDCLHKPGTCWWDGRGAGWSNIQRRKAGH